MTTIQLGNTAKRQIEWNVPAATITGTIQWEGQAAKSISGLIAYRETLNNVHFYDWAYDAADRPTAEAVGVISLVDGTTSVSVAVSFVFGTAAAIATPEAKAAIRAAINGEWMDGNGATFVLTVTDP